MDYFNYILATFLGLDRIRFLFIYGRVRELLKFIKNILICVPKMKEGLTGLEQHEGEQCVKKIKMTTLFNNYLCVTVAPFWRESDGPRHYNFL